MNRDRIHAAMLAIQEADANAPIEDGCVPTHWMPLPEPPK